ncbi:MAG: hypothetical protein A3G75_08680 [Verrucomicrobia bacterium RIFCSPLOWO2_12_FULL_64_8]|nr:MAG: hypothetical protein A3G75_08680 [Verrucomicrobia bacterium RIFCSPLOWO2_12_FULL_64_8]
MFTILGADGKAYGPATVEQVKAWIAAGRANLQTRARREGTAEWKTLAEYPEFAGEAGGGTPPGAAAPRVVDAKAFAADLVARAPKLGIGGTIGRSWELLKNNFWPLVGVTFVVVMVQAMANAVPFLGMLAGLLLGGGFTGGLYYYYLRRLRGEPVEFADAFAGFTLAFVPLMLAGLVSSLLTGLGLLLLILPGIYLAVAWTFTYLLIIDQKLEFWTAMEVSRRVISAQWWRMFGLLILAGIVAALGVVLLVVGIFFTLPIAYGSLVVAYETLCRPPSRA